MMGRNWNLTGYTVLWVLSAAVVCIWGGQMPLHGPSSLRTPPYSGNNICDEANLFTPHEELQLLSSTQFTSLTHPGFPKYGVRVKKSKFCDGGVDSYTGYIDVGARHLFFYFFESRRDPDNDDTIFWTTGGPGGSSAMGLFQELGPCRVIGDNETQYHPESWNEIANVFFVDQPIGVGFSYADYGESVSTTEEAAQDIAAFIAIFFEHFTKFRGRALHMAGESYGGRYIPLFASAVYDQNAHLKDMGLTPINLKSAMIGNGLTDFFTMTTSYYDMACTVAGQPVLDISTCVRMKEVVPRCQSSLKRSCVDQFDKINCYAANTFCNAELFEPFLRSGRNLYDITKMCDGELTDTLCYPITKNITNYLNIPSVQTSLGIDPSSPAYGNYTVVSMEVGMAFDRALDHAHPTQHYVEQLLHRGIKVLIYVGTNDFVCNWIGNLAWVSAMEWYSPDHSGRREKVGPLKPWGGASVSTMERWGMIAQGGGLTFATIDGAGHMVPYDKPKESLELVKRWLEATTEL